MAAAPPPEPPRPWPVPAWLAALLAVAVALLATHVTPAADGALYRAPFLAACGLGLVLAVRGAWRLRGSASVATPVLIALACSYWGDVGWTMDGVLFGGNSWPAWTDACFASSYPFLAAAGLLALRRQQAGRDMGALLDSLIVTVGVGVLAYVFVIADAASNPASTGPERVLGTLYPLADVLVAGVLVRLMITVGRQRTSLVFVAGGIAALLLGDVLFDAAVFAGTQQVVNRLGDSCYVLFYLFLALGLSHPQAGRTTPPGERDHRRMSPWRIAAFGVGALLAPVTLVLQEVSGRDHHELAASVGAVVLFSLVLVRMTLLIRAVEWQSRELARLARTDALTGLPNRRTFDFELDRALAWAAAAPGGLLTVALIDLDRFKQYNDTRGHGAGDQLLRECAAHWLEALERASDGDRPPFLARYGGEEFAVIFRGRDDATAAEALGAALAATPGGQTFSAGVAVWDGAVPAPDLLEQADTRLYAAKTAGRNRIVAGAAAGLTPTAPA